MKYTLDSITHVIEVLHNENIGKEIVTLPIYADDLSMFDTKTEQRLFFGIVTVGTDTNGQFFKPDGSEILTVSSNSQIIELFSYITFEKDDETFQGSPLGHFRGFEIFIK